MGNPWDGYIPQETLELYRQAGFGAACRDGVKAALLVIDMQYATTGEAPMPLPAALAYHPMNCGESAWTAIGHMKPLISAFRQSGLPVIYTGPPDHVPAGAGGRMPGGRFDPRHQEIVEEIAPGPADIILPKTAPSAFFGTPLVKHLLALGADTVFVVGNTTSGCIRATVIDAMSYGYKVVIPHEACYDRSPVSHAVNLFDMASKYAEVVSTDEATKMLAAMLTGSKAQAPA